MGASKKILPRKRHRANDQESAGKCETPELQPTSARLGELENENIFLQKENKRLRGQLDFWRSQVEQDSSSEDEHHWRRRYAIRNEEASDLEGLLGLRDREIADLKKELAHKNAKIKKLRKQLHGRSSEQDPIQPSPVAGSEPGTTEPPQPKPASKPAPARPRGGQPGTKRNGPKHHNGLPLGEEFDYTVPESCCAECGEQWKELSTRESDEVVVNVRAYRRRHRRKKYKHFCKKKDRWVTKTAQGPNRLFGNSNYGISFWVFLLVGRFALHIPTNRLRMLLLEHKLDVSLGTITGGFKRIAKLIKPLIAEIRRYSRENKHHWHLDDTGWKVFVKLDGKEGFKWQLWVFLSDDVCVYILSPSRARAVPKSHLENSCGVVTSDRLAANMKLGEFIENSFCWVHERREFRELAAAYPELFAICDHFLKLIGSLFHYNKLRLLHEPTSAESIDSDCKLKLTLDQIQKDCQTELAKPDLHPELKRVFKGILRDWDGLYLFFEMPAVPPDNNLAEQALRGPVSSRKCSYGSGSEWSAEFLADMYTLTETLRLNNINKERFLTDYLERCAANEGKPPKDAARLLPWNTPPPQN